MALVECYFWQWLCIYFWYLYFQPPLFLLPLSFCVFLKKDKHLLKKLFHLNFHVARWPDVLWCCLVKQQRKSHFDGKNSIKCIISLFMSWRNSVFDEVNNWALKTKKKSLRKLWQKNIWSSQQLRKWRYTLYFCQRNQTEPGWFSSCWGFPQYKQGRRVSLENIKANSFDFRWEKLGMKKNIDWIFYLSEGLVKSFKIISLVISAVHIQKYLLFQKQKKNVMCT